LPTQWCCELGIAKEAGVIDPGVFKPHDGIGVLRNPIVQED
jgi:hypothetical protein